MEGRRQDKREAPSPPINATAATTLPPSRAQMADPKLLSLGLSSLLPPNVVLGRAPVVGPSGSSERKGGGGDHRRRRR
jgi:hypothetical protein